MNKLDALVSMAGITKDDHVLEIGCGWGSMAIRAVQVGPPALTSPFCTRSLLHHAITDR